MDALFGGRQNFHPSYIFETSLRDANDESKQCDESFLSDAIGNDDDLDDHDYSKDQRDLTTSDNPNDDPVADEYWTENDTADPGRQANAPLDHEVEARHSGNGKGKSKVVPRKFPTPEKRLPPRKDFSSMYMVAQNETTQLKREKFEYMKENNKSIQAAAAVMDLQRAKALFVEKIVTSGVVGAEKIRELLSIAFAQE
ncbi:hypothetical protein H257_01304 [Aphanomyces astaci]|uniref:Uncharacterized protein n=1 Tax=Aphanomyces astaci TaxID=112090 RepID=W4H9D2_APHAT|nr:hypothetical protein H257_01304 [Aphanomyces astaci]ETV87889.1 hypothetical protein H257_01304 [Aphanomyces astaci]|eukprot:XP_009822752.1 hypothetical protein H257_01304 [Aphanomyces astaci]